MTTTAMTTTAVNRAEFSAPILHRATLQQLAEALRLARRFDQPKVVEMFRAEIRRRFTHETA